ncbi:MAG TPA: CaiB/BaiF CoA-transferase family protein [Propionibacteriaceae bacterium]
MVAKTQATGPLVGVRVIELAGIGPAPFAAMMLAELGADVVRVDRPGAASPIPTDPHFDLLNRGKRSIALDLKQPADLTTLRSLIARAGVLVEGYRPGVAERLGVGPDACHRSLVYGRMTGWGQDGPLASTAGHDITYIAATGALDAIGSADGRPQPPLNLVGDFGGGALYLVVGILAALRHAEATGQGQVVDAAIVDGTAHLTTMMHAALACGEWEGERGHNLLDSGAAQYDTYATADDRYLAVGSLEPKFFAELVRVLGVADRLPAPPERDDWDAAHALIAAAFRTRTRDAWVEAFAGTDACVEPVLTFAEAPSHPHLAARGTFAERDGVVQPAPAPRFSRTPTALSSAPPMPGQDTDEVLRDWGVRLRRVA